MFVCEKHGNVPACAICTVPVINHDRLINYAVDELKRSGYEDPVKAAALAMLVSLVNIDRNAVLRIQAARIVLDLVRFRNISPLTDDPAEWQQSTSANGLWQSTRNKHAWSYDGGLSFWFDNHVSAKTVYMRSAISGKR